MVRVFCDKCGEDCDNNAFDFKITAIENPCPLYPLDKGDARLSTTNYTVRFILCQKCYRELGMPNVFETQRTKKIRFRSRTV